MAGHDECARGGVAGAGVDAKGPGAGGVVGGANALHVLNGPLGALSHHGLAAGRSSEGRGDGQEGSQEDLSELHVGDVVRWKRDVKARLLIVRVTRMELR